MEDNRVGSSLYPVWRDDAHLDPAWLRAALGGRLPGAVLACSAVEDRSNETRRAAAGRVRDGATLAFRLTIRRHPGALEDEEEAPAEASSSATTELPLVLKQVPEAGLGLSRALGLAREALFYRDLALPAPAGAGGAADALAPLLPVVYYAAGDPVTGAKTVFMEDLSARAVDSAVFFAPKPSGAPSAGWRGNPHLWNRRDEVAALPARFTAASSVPSQRDVALATFRSVARVHAHFWRRADRLLRPDLRWLRGQEWLQGHDRASWEAAQDVIRQSWTKFVAGPGDGIVWDPLVRAATDRAMGGISWEAHQQRLHLDGPWTLVHGDFWPGNVLWMLEDDAKDSMTQIPVRLIDWEMCGLGSGPQDLGQYVISNMEPSERRSCERELLRAYHDELMAGGVEVTFDYCWSEYRIGGVERWLWFLVYFVCLEGFTEWAQFFHDQIAAFMHDHNLTADDIVQPRP